MPLGELTATGLTEAQFSEISDLVRSLSGISLHDGKQELVKARLARRLRALGIRSFDEYIDYLRNDASGSELVAMLDAVSTNKTSFFREQEHFEYLGGTVLPRITAAVGASTRKLRIWSAGCSSGEEPYSIAIAAAEALGDLASWDIRILATDLSTRVLGQAMEAGYDAERLEDVPPLWKTRYFQRLPRESERRYRVTESIRRMVTFARLNLMDPWPMRGPFDVIFCRNVMIYFDNPTKARLICRFWDLLRRGGTLFMGHSESLAGIRNEFRYVQPTVYEKP